MLMRLSDKNKKLLLSGFFIAFIGAIFFSTKAILVKLAYADTPVDAVTLLTLRMAFALPFYIAIGLHRSNHKQNIFFTRKQWLYVLLLGFIGYYMSSLFDFIGLQYVSAGLERLILFIYPTLVLLMSAFLFKQKINGYQKLAVILTYVGILIAFLGELKIDSTNPNFYYGTFMIFLCAVAFSVYIVGSGRMIPETGATKFTSYAMTAAAAGIIIHFLISGRTMQVVNGHLILYAILLAVVATVIPTFFISNAIRKIGSANVAIIGSIGPVSTILQAHYILGERISVGQVIGTILVITGVILIGIKGRGNFVSSKPI